VGIGTDSPVRNVSVFGSSSAVMSFHNSTTGSTISDGMFIGNDANLAYVFNYEATPLIFATDATESMRITSGGYLKASNGATYFSSTGSYHELNQTTGGEWSTIIHNNTAAPYGLYINYSSAAPNSGGSEFIYCADSSAQRFFVTSAGALYGNGTYGTISDRKLKENIVDATPKLDDINKLKVRNFNFKDNPEEKHIGFIAQELEEVFPKAVETKQDKDEDNNIIEDSYTKTIKTSILIPMLVKSIQELKAEVDDLKNKCNCK